MKFSDLLLRQLVAVDQFCSGYEVLLYRALLLYERLCALLETKTLVENYQSIDPRSEWRIFLTYRKNGITIPAFLGVGNSSGRWEICFAQRRRSSYVFRTGQNEETRNNKTRCEKVFRKFIETVQETEIEDTLPVER